MSEQKAKLLCTTVLMMLIQNSSVSIPEKWEHAAAIGYARLATQQSAVSRFSLEFLEDGESLALKLGRSTPHPVCPAIFPPHLSCHFDTRSPVA